MERMSSVQEDRVSLGLSPSPLISLDLNSIVSLVSLLLDRLQPTVLNLDGLGNNNNVEL